MSTKVVRNPTWAIALKLVLVALMVASPSVSAIPCSTVVMDLVSCLSYLTGRADDVTVPCCRGVDTLNNMVKTSDDRQTVCVCLKQAASSFGVNPDRAAALPEKCHVKVDYPISPDVDCNKLALVDGGSV